MFLAKDVAEWIDYSKNSQGKYNVNSMLSTVDEEEKLVLKVLIPGDTQKRNATLLTEDGLYEVLMQSRKPIAKQIFGGIKMNNLVVQNINDRLYVDSREVVEMTGKIHSHLLRDIKNYKATLDNANVEMKPELASTNFFIPATYQDNLNRTKPCYLLTRKGCDMVANKMTGDKGA